ncbi:hypothetical protein GC722_14710 [Auraticoccus sp. F435]|uniref:Polysaccharide chain length determinant N-terminal domain-containing protein n=1 Tax=Auraticoccus cholistanensis TaxID=2656650 RepID=A0A6A9UZ88_9ACTN|nr:hypothetical protein [Auraticoccus cholistanensis]MVA77264.1 hypothetical protein [Auraticoccus cholistanensis]
MTITSAPTTAVRDAGGSAARHVAPWPGSSPGLVLQTVRRWFWLPLGLGLAGALIGGGIGTDARPTAETLLVVQASSQDSTNRARVVETAVRELSAPGIYERAGQDIGADPAELRSRTRVSSTATSDVISVTVTADDPTQAVRESAAVARAGVELRAERTEIQLQQLAQDTRQLMDQSDWGVEDLQAERARVEQLGLSLAASQSYLVANSEELVVIQESEPAESLVSRLTLAALSGLGGVLLGVGASLFLGTRVGRVGSLRRLRRMFPNLPALRTEDLAPTVAMEGTAIRTVLVTRIGSVPLWQACRLVSDTLREAGHPVRRTTNIVHALTADQTSRPPQGGIDVVSSRLTPTVIRRVARDPHVLLLVAVDPRTVRLEWLDRSLHTLGERAYFLVDNG